MGGGEITGAKGREDNKNKTPRANNSGVINFDHPKFSLAISKWGPKFNSLKSHNFAVMATPRYHELSGIVFGRY